MRIKAAREKLGMTVLEAGKAWGINPRTLQNWEQGHRSPRGAAKTYIEKIIAEADKLA